MIPKLKAEQGVTDEPKISNQLEWVGRMNNIVVQVEEMIYNDIVYN